MQVCTSVLVVSMLVFDWTRGVGTTIASCDELCYPMSSPNLWALSTPTYNSALSTPVYLSTPSYTNTMATYSSAQHESLCAMSLVYQSQCGQVHFLVFSGPQGDGGTIALVHHVLSSTQPCSLFQPPSNEEEYDEAWFRASLLIKMNSYFKMPQKFMPMLQIVQPGSMSHSLEPVYIYTTSN